MLKYARLDKTKEGKFQIGDIWYVDDLSNSIQEWIALHRELGYEDIEECEAEIVGPGSEIIPDKIYSLEGTLYALKEENVMKVRYPKKKPL